MKRKFKISKQTVIRAILIALIISVMVIIFVLSAEDSRDSSDTSGSFTSFVLRLFGIDAEGMSLEEFTKAEAFVRSAAHFSEYALLAFLAVLLLATYRMGRAPALGFSTVFASLYAVTDEIHQIFVPGRAAQFSDWLVDTSGAATGALLAFLVLLITAAIKKRSLKPKIKTNRKNKKSKA